MAAQKVLIVASALLVQTVFGQITVSNNGINSIGVTNTGIGSANLFGAGLSNGVGMISTGISNAAGLVGAGLGSGIGVTGTGLNNAGLIGTGFGSAGLVGAGLSNTGVIGTGLGLNTGLTGVTFNLGGLSIGSSSPLVVTNISPIGPSGLAVASENVIDGTLLVSGSLPFLSAVSFEGTLPTAGTGIATCGCGNGAVGIINV